MANGAGNLNVRMTTSLREFIQKMNSADRMLARREKRLDRLRAQISATESRLRGVRGQVGGIGIGAARQLGTGALTLALQSAITQSGLETGGFFGRLAIGVGTGAAFGGGAPGAVIAGITVIVSELITVIGKMGERLKKVEEANTKIQADVKAAIAEVEKREQETRDQLAVFAAKLDTEGEKEFKELLFQTQRAQLVGAGG